MKKELQFLHEQQVDESLIQEVEVFHTRYAVDESVKNRIVTPAIPFYGKEVLEMAIAALLQGENLLLTGSKATGKNVLAENLAYIFGRPSYNVSFHVNTDSGDLIGTDTFRNNEVELRKGSIYQCAEYGGFGILDEINMAKNDAVSVLHATLDYRRSIDVPGYDKIDLHEATRFIGTMNYGYAGTKELNEALVSRFLVIDMPPQTEETLEFILQKFFPDMRKNALEQCTGVFMDLQLKAANSEISTKSLDLRGMLGALSTIQRGLSPFLGMQMGIVNKCFDIFEKEIVQDVVMTRIPKDWLPADVFGS
jgi:nitric oxide reductase NorQ protein